MFNYSRRVNRFTFLVGIFLAVCGLIILDIVQALIEGANDELFNDNPIIGFIHGSLILVGLLVFFVYVVGVTRQRANDIGWHPLLLTVFVCWNPLMIVMALVPGENRTNKYGGIPQKRLELT